MICDHLGVTSTVWYKHNLACPLPPNIQTEGIRAGLVLSQKLKIDLAKKQPSKEPFAMMECLQLDVDDAVHKTRDTLHIVTQTHAIQAVSPTHARAFQAGGHTHEDEFTLKALNTVKDKLKEILVTLSLEMQRIKS